MNKFAILIPCYNCGKTIQATLDSLLIALAKIEQDWQIYLYDDASSDNSINIIKGYSLLNPNIILNVNNANLGERKNTDLGLNYVSTIYDWVFILNHDDIVYEECFTSYISIFNKKDTNALFSIWSSYNVIDQQGLIISHGDNRNIEIHLKDFSKRNIIRLIKKTSTPWRISGCFINLKILNKLKGFDPHFNQYHDSDLYIRSIINGYASLYISMPLSAYRILFTSVSETNFNKNKDIEDRKYFIKKYLNILGWYDVFSMCLNILILLGKRKIKKLKRVLIR